jgi:hypothetical protein
MYNYSLDFRITGQEARKDIQRDGLQSEKEYSFDEWKTIVKEAIESIEENEIQYITTNVILRKIVELHNDFKPIDWKGSVFIEMEQNNEGGM